jgi:hypothetical protein
MKIHVSLDGEPKELAEFIRELSMSKSLDLALKPGLKITNEKASKTTTDPLDAGIEVLNLPTVAYNGLILHDVRSIRDLEVLLKNKVHIPFRFGPKRRAETEEKLKMYKHQHPQPDDVTDDGSID